MAQNTTFNLDFSKLKAICMFKVFSDKLIPIELGFFSEESDSFKKNSSLWHWISYFFRARFLEWDAKKSDLVPGPPVGLLDNLGELFFCIWLMFFYLNKYFTKELHIILKVK